MTRRNMLPIFLSLPLFYSLSSFAEANKTVNDSSEQVTEFTMTNASNLNDAKMLEFKKEIENSISKSGKNSKMSLDLVAQIYLQNAQSIADHPEEFKKLFDNSEDTSHLNSNEFVASSGTFIDVNLPSKIVIKPDNLLKLTNKINYQVVKLSNISLTQKNENNVDCVALFKFEGLLSTMKVYGTGVSISCLNLDKKIIIKPLSAALVDSDNSFGLNSELVLDKNVESNTKLKETLEFENTHPVKVLISNSIILPSIKKL